MMNNIKYQVGKEADFLKAIEASTDQNYSEEYTRFVSKFAPPPPKKTTDDCYTPPEIYNAVKDWCLDKYNLNSARILRPFYPGGDYQSVEYTKDSVVIDNPPFSIISQICYWYMERKIRFFLFAPTLSLFSAAAGKANYIVCDNSIIYENGARVNTSFVTNMGNVKITTAPELNKRLKDIRKRQHSKNKNKIEYPDNVITAAQLTQIAKSDASFEVRAEECKFIRKIDAYKKGLYGAGFLISDRAAQRKADIEKSLNSHNDSGKLPLSDRERAIIKSLR